MEHNQDQQEVGGQSRNDQMMGGLGNQMDGRSAPEGAEGDISLACRDCGGTFLFTVGEQEFYSMKGFEGPPTRCKPCRAQKKMSRESSNTMNYPMNYMMMDGYGMPYYPPGGGFGGGNPQPRKPCHAFQRGNCMYGADCRYSHDEAGGAGGYPGGFNGGYPMGAYGGGMDQNYGGGFGGGPHRRQQPRSRNPCFAFQRGNCTYGDSCRYSHDIEPGSAPPPAMGAGGQRLMCHAFQQGDCKYGDSCRFAHEN
jgi:hypothetical protein